MRRIGRSAAVLACLTLVGVGDANSSPLCAQHPSRPVHRPRQSPAADALERADELYFSGRPLRSLEELEELLRERPGTFDALWRASRAAASLGLLEEEVPDQNHWYRRGADYGRRAADASPERVEGHYWRAANAGLHAVQAGSPGTIADLAEEVYASAHRVLELDPEHAGAHNVLGRLHFEIMELSFFERLLARSILGAGASVGNASWDGAERHLSRAVELDPDFILYRLDLGRLHLRRDRPVRAVEQLRAAVRLDPIHPPDPDFKDRARRLLRRARKERPADPGSGPGAGDPESGSAVEGRRP